MKTSLRVIPGILLAMFLDGGASLIIVIVKAACENKCLARSPGQKSKAEKKTTFLIVPFLI